MEDLIKVLQGIALAVIAYFLKKHDKKVDDLEKQVQKNTTAIAVAEKEKEMHKEHFDMMLNNIRDHIDDKFTDLKELINAKK